jgi:hemoglobin
MSDHTSAPADPGTTALHPATCRLLSRRGFIVRAGAGAAGLTFLGLAVAGCTDDDSSAPASTTTTTPPSATGSLYDRLGGGPAVTAVVGTFLGKVAADDRINGFFAETDLTNLQTQVVNQIGEASGGPEVYTGGTMQAVHEGLGITVADFNAFVEDLVATLDELNVPEAEQQELLDVLAPMQTDIVEA